MGLMSPGIFELVLLIFCFVGLQAWWIIPLVKKNSEFNLRTKGLREEIKQLEKLYRK